MVKVQDGEVYHEYLHSSYGAECVNPKCPGIGRDGEYLEVIKLPTKWVICPECGGEGEHSHAIDGDGLTASDFDEWGPEDTETYFSGGYDKGCERCDGSGKVREVDQDRCPPKLWKAFMHQVKDEADYRMEVEAERRMGA